MVHSAIVYPVVDLKVRAICTRPYGLKENGKYSHPKGCPNFGNRDLCPPQAPHFNDLIDISMPIVAIYARFDFAGYVEKMRSKHPDWSQRQLECCLYWQGTVRKELRLETESFVKENPGYSILTCPEGNGVNVTATMKKLGIDLEWPPVKWVYKVAIAGIKK